MKRQAIGLTGQDPELKQLVKELTEIDQEYDERMTFLRKQQETIENEIQARVDSVWTRLHERVKAMGLLPEEFNPKTWDVGLSKDGVVYAEDHSDCCGGMSPDKRKKRHQKGGDPSGGILVALSRLFDR